MRMIAYTVRCLRCGAPAQLALFEYAPEVSLPTPEGVRQELVFSCSHGCAIGESERFVMWATVALGSSNGVDTKPPAA
jgi:hypothetical protein